MLHTGIVVASSALNQTPLDWSGNKARVLEAIAFAKKEEASLLLLPELCLSGYDCEDAFFTPHTEQQSLRLLEELLPATKGLIVALGLPLRIEGYLYNAIALCIDGQVAGFTLKQHLANYGVYYEARWFTPWPTDTITEITFRGSPVPVGDIVFDVGGIRIGFEICMDAWVVPRTLEHLLIFQPDIILNPSASHFALEKSQKRYELVQSGAKMAQLVYVLANQLGNAAGRILYEGQTLIAAGSDLIASGQEYVFQEIAGITACVDLEPLRAKRKKQKSLTRDQKKRLIMIPYVWNVPKKVISTPIRFLTLPLEEQFSRMQALALFDYLRKSKAQGFVVSLSGGVDSSLCSVLVATMVHLGLEQLGEQRFAQRLAHIPLPLDQSAKGWIAHLLYTVYQKTNQSSKETQEAAKLLAEELGAKHIDIHIEPIVKEYLNLFEKALRTKFTWEKDDLLLQNIQSRVRAPSSWLLANAKDFLLLATMNRSEAMCGYTTMDGDSSGSLAPLAGIDKHFLRALARWFEKQGLAEMGKISALGKVNRLAPTAELRPLSALQTDEDDLMPYAILARIEHWVIYERKTPKEVLALLREHYPLHPDTKLVQYTVKFFNLFPRAQWKRERFAVTFNVDYFNADPKTGFRFPVLSGNYQQELEELIALQQF